jgi:uncharacterized protein (DUF1501 family)
MQRRTLLKYLASGAVLMHSPSLFALNTKAESTKRVIWIVQRGAVDGLHTVIPTFEKRLATLRPDLFNAVRDALPLQQGFAIHPSLSTMHSWFNQKELSCVVATGTGYKGRSHFDGQDFLESGLQHADLQSGWVGRAMDTLDSEGIAISKVSPLGFRPSRRGQIYYPAKLDDAKDNLFEDLQKLYQYDDMLGSSLMAGLEVKEAVMQDGKKSGRDTFSKLCAECTNLLKAKPNIQFAMLDIGGWDTHKAQNNRLAREFSQLDQGLAQLKKGLGEEWKNTLVLVTSEFGRTVKQNGTGGTDHGTAGVMFIAGGAVKGGHVLGDWPGVGENDLFEGRDLAPTSSTFSWMAKAVGDHLGLNNTQIERIFPFASA